jgi:hypothetical protein
MWLTSDSTEYMCSICSLTPADSRSTPSLEASSATLRLPFGRCTDLLRLDLAVLRPTIEDRLFRSSAAANTGLRSASRCAKSSGRDRRSRMLCQADTSARLPPRVASGGAADAADARARARASGTCCYSIEVQGRAPELSLKWREAVIHTGDSWSRRRLSSGLDRRARGVFSGCPRRLRQPCCRSGHEPAAPAVVGVR